MVGLVPIITEALETKAEVVVAALVRHSRQVPSLPRLVVRDDNLP